MFFRHHRFQIWSGEQHPYFHRASEVAFVSKAFGNDVITVQGALDWIVAVLYPNVQDAVDTPDDLPSTGNSLNDYRVVNDDGDGNPAAYRWEQREGDAAAKWYKVADYDWSADAILSAFENKHQGLFVYKQGIDDTDSDGAALTGDSAGQHIWGGVSANTHLTLHANSGDGTGAQTGYVQFADSVRPFADSSYSLGTDTYRWLNVFTDEAQVGTLNITDGSITDSSGAIDFGDENLSTTGGVMAGAFITGTLTILDGQITDSDGTISFDDTNLTTTGSITGGLLTIDNVQISGNTVSITNTDGDLNLAANGTGVVNVQSAMTTLGITATGTVSITGQLDVDQMRLDGATISTTTTDQNLTLDPNGSGKIILSASTDLTGTLAVTGAITVDNLSFDGNTLSTTNTNGNLILDPNGTGQITAGSKISPDANGSYDLGAALFRFRSLYLSTGISDGSNAITMTTLLSLRDVLTDIADGDTIFWDAANSKFVASNPDTEIDHGTIAGLTDSDDHTQYALLDGRSGGQTLIGGTGAGDDLLLQSTSNATKGHILIGDDLAPSADATLDLGSSSAQWADLYLSGQAFGLRIQNFADQTALDGATGTEGRLAWKVDDEDLYIGTGAAWKQVSTDAYYNEDAVNWDGSTTTVTYDVSSATTNARRMIWQFKINGSDYEISAVKIDHPTQTSVRVTVEEALTAGTYTLVGR